MVVLDGCAFSTPASVLAARELSLSERSSVDAEWVKRFSISSSAVSWYLGSPHAPWASPCMRGVEGPGETRAGSARGGVAVYNAARDLGGLWMKRRVEGSPYLGRPDFAGFLVLNTNLGDWYWMTECSRPSFLCFEGGRTVEGSESSSSDAACSRDRFNDLATTGDVSSESTKLMSCIGFLRHILIQMSMSMGSKSREGLSSPNIAATAAIEDEMGVLGEMWDEKRKRCWTWSKGRVRSKD